MSNQNDSTARTLVGRVICNKMNKTAVVLIERKVEHPRYGKYVTRRTKWYAHDENNISEIGDLVSIKETRPLSKMKNCTLVEVLQKSSRIAGNE